MLSCVFCFVLFLGEFTHLPFTMFFNSKYSQQVPLINSNLYVFQLICIVKSNSSRIFALSKNCEMSVRYSALPVKLFFVVVVVPC